MEKKKVKFGYDKASTRDSYRRFPILEGQTDAKSKITMKIR